MAEQGYYLNGLLDQAAINGLKGMGDPEGIQDIIDTFIEEIQKDIKTLQSLMDFRDQSALYATTHKMKGTAGIVGAAAMSANLERINTMTKDGVKLSDKIKKEIKREYRELMTNWASTQSHIHEAYGVMSK